MSPSRLPVLIAEDNAVLQAAVRFMLTSWGYAPVMAGDGAEAWEILRGDSAPRMALLDWEMPGLDGVEVCRRVRAARREPYTYIMLLTGRTDSSDLLRAMDAGADDYVRKPFDAQELRARLNAGKRIIQLQQELMAAREKLRAQATEDSLTGLLNHGSILTALENAVAGQGGAAILLADVDRFRQINESFGHPAGDEVLREFARRLRQVTPAEARVGRYGGEEFLVVLPGCDSQTARLCADRLREAIRGASMNAGAASFPVTCSVGVACGDDAAGLLRQADEALFWAKREGRNQMALPQTAEMFLTQIAP